MNVAPLTLLPFRPLDVVFAILRVGFPRAAVIFKLQLVHHHDAFFHRTDLRTLPAAGAVFKSNVVQPVGRWIETLVGAFEPAERAFRANIEANHGTLSLGRATLEGLVARLTLWPHFEMPFDGGNCRALAKLEPLRQNRDFVRPFDPLAQLYCPACRAYFLVGLACRFCAEEFLRMLFAQISLDWLNADNVRINASHSAKGSFVSEIVPENPQTSKTGIPFVGR